jgi:5-methylcytosine-specific restriction endonuclease McrA
MPIVKLSGLTGLAKPLTSDEGRRILERDQYRCQYCGLDGLSSFENSLVMTVDFIHPRARKGKKDPSNLVTACRPCNLLKGERVYRDLEHAKSYVLQKRDELRKEWESTKAKKAHSAKAGGTPALP